MHQGHRGPSVGQMPHPTPKSHLCAHRGVARGPSGMFLVAPPSVTIQRDSATVGSGPVIWKHPSSLYPPPHHLIGRLCQVWAQTEIQPTLGNSRHFRGKGSCYGAFEGVGTGVGVGVCVRARALIAVLQECCPALAGKLPWAVGLPSLSTSVLCLSGFRLCSLHSSTLASPSSLALPPYPLPV